MKNWIIQKNKDLRVPFINEILQTLFISLHKKYHVKFIFMRFIQLRMPIWIITQTLQDLMTLFKSHETPLSLYMGECFVTCEIPIEILINPQCHEKKSPNVEKSSESRGFQDTINKWEIVVKIDVLRNR